MLLVLVVLISDMIIQFPLNVRNGGHSIGVCPCLVHYKVLSTPCVIRVTLYLWVDRKHSLVDWVYQALKPKL